MTQAQASIAQATTPAPPTLSLIVCTVGRTAPLARLLDSLMRQTRRDFEILLVDQNPPGTLDETLAPVRDALEIRHLTSPRGLSRARNVGLAAARGAIFCFPDDDCWYPPHQVADIIARFERAPDLDLVMGRTVDAEGVESLGLFLRNSARIDRENVWFAGNSNTIFLRADLAKRIGPFDETLGVGAATPFRSGEETDYVLRALALGARAHFDRDLVVHHDQVAGGGEAALARARAYAPGFGRVLRLHYGPAYFIKREARTLARAALAALTLDFATARYKLVWALGAAKGYFAAPPA